MNRLIKRRQFLTTASSGAAGIALGSHLPACFAQAAESSADFPERILIVVQLSGGNDGLNTVVPFANPDYYAARPKLAVPKSDVLALDDQCGLHPSLSGMMALVQDGRAAVVQGVGYERPNRSHFESMDIWHTCRRKDQPRENGWLGRYLEQTRPASGGDVPALHLGQHKQPFALMSESIRVPTVGSLEEFQLRGEHAERLGRFLQSPATAPAAASPPPPVGSSNDLLEFVKQSTAEAVTASQRVRAAAQAAPSPVEYPQSTLADKLRVIAQLIDSGLPTRVYYVQHDGFDTHAQQAETHRILLRQWSDAVSALIEDLERRGHGERVCVMSFSEFGRRVAENASEGTDHGAAGPMFLCGGGLRAGLAGRAPDLTDLENGDLKHHVDFRRVYATVLRDWMAATPEPIVGGQYASLPLFG